MRVFERLFMLTSANDSRTFICQENSNFIKWNKEQLISLDKVDLICVCNPAPWRGHYANIETWTDADWASAMEIIVDITRLQQYNTQYTLPENFERDLIGYLLAN